MPNLRNGSKGGFEPGLTRLRVRQSTTELPRSIRGHSSVTCQISQKKTLRMCNYEAMGEYQISQKKSYVNLGQNAGSTVIGLMGGEWSKDTVRGRR